MAGGAESGFRSVKNEDADVGDIPDGEGMKIIFRLSDDSGFLALTEVKAPINSAADLPSGDVFIIDNGKHCYVWVGSSASAAERQKSLTYANNYLKKTMHPLVPVTAIKEGQETSEFESAIAA